MPIQAQSADGQVHEFPDGTPGAVVDRAMREYAMEQKNAPSPAPETQPAGDEPSWGDTASFLGKRFLTSAASLPGVPADLAGIAARNLPTGAGTFIPILGPTITAEQIRMRQPGADRMTPLGTENIRGAIDDLSGGTLTPRAPKTDFERYGGAVADFAGAVAPTMGAGAIPATGRALAIEGGASLTGGIGQEAARDIALDAPLIV